MSTPGTMSTSLTGTFEAIVVEDQGGAGSEEHRSYTEGAATRGEVRGSLTAGECDSDRRDSSRATLDHTCTNMTEVSAEPEAPAGDARKPLQAQDVNMAKREVSRTDCSSKRKTAQSQLKQTDKSPDTVKRKSEVLEDRADRDDHHGGSGKTGKHSKASVKTELSKQEVASPAGSKQDKSDVTPAKSEPAAGGEGTSPTGSRRGKDSSNTFVKDWEFVQTLGEGAYGEVKLAYNVKTKEAVAVKIIDFATKTTNPTIMDDIRKEVCIHRMINHPNIIKFYGVRKDGMVQYLFLEYASGGELFDRIEPDVGMPQPDAQRYFQQLIDGLEYLHSKGIAHRDIKPENLLLDENDTLKIADFGLATIFRHQGKWRYLERVCGSAPYLAPEVISRPYKAEPADIWSCGIVLVAMLGGELPWDAPVLACVQYCEWRECHIENKPWSKIDNLALCLIRRLLADKAERRYTIEEIRKNQWFKKDFTKDPVEHMQMGHKRFRTGHEAGQSPGLVTLSQPEISRPSLMPTTTHEASGVSGKGSNMAGDDCPISFSQPAQTDDMLLGSQVSSTQSSQTPLQKLVRRMTRFFTKHTKTEVVAELDRVFSLLAYTWKYSNNTVVTVQTVDRRQTMLTFKVMILDMGESHLVDFRLSKGDGLEFKRHFLRIRELMKPIICKVPPTWPNLPDL